MQVCVECTVRTKGGASPAAKVLCDLALAEAQSKQCTPAQVYSALGLASDATTAGALTVGARKPGPKAPKDLPRLDPASVTKVLGQRQVMMLYSSLRVSIDLSHILF